MWRALTWLTSSKTMSLEHGAMEFWAWSNREREPRVSRLFGLCLSLVCSTWKLHSSAVPLSPVELRNTFALNFRICSCYFSQKSQFVFAISCQNEKFNLVFSTEVSWDRRQASEPPRSSLIIHLVCPTGGKRKKEEKPRVLVALTLSSILFLFLKTLLVIISRFFPLQLSCVFTPFSYRFTSNSRLPRWS